MKFLKNQTGSLHLAALAIFVVLAVVGFAGYRVMSANNNKTVVTTASQQTSPAKLTSSKDLDTATASLDNTPVDTGVNPDQLNQDLNELL